MSRTFRTAEEALQFHERVNGHLSVILEGGIECWNGKRFSRWKKRFGSLSSNGVFTIHDGASSSAPVEQTVHVASVTMESAGGDGWVIRGPSSQCHIRVADRSAPSASTWLGALRHGDHIARRPTDDGSAPPPPQRKEREEEQVSKEEPVVAEVPVKNWTFVPYVVQEEDSIISIAVAHDMSTQQLVRHNGMRMGDRVCAGDVLKVRQAASEEVGAHDDASAAQAAQFVFGGKYTYEPPSLAADPSWVGTEMPLAEDSGEENTPTRERALSAAERIKGDILRRSFDGQDSLTDTDTS